MSRSRAKGTSWESAVVDYLRTAGWPHAERRALNGAKDRGDVAGVAGVMIEAKSEVGIHLAAYMNEVEVEQANDNAAVGVAWIKRRGRGSAAHGYVVMTGEQFAALLRAAGYGGA